MCDYICTNYRGRSGAVSLSVIQQVTVSSKAMHFILTAHKSYHTHTHTLTGSGLSSVRSEAGPE